MAKDRGSFWSSVPGFFTGLAGVLTAVVGLLTVSYNLGWIGGGADDTGTGAGPGSPEVELSVTPSEVDFRPVAGGSSETVTVRNDGGEPVDVEASEITGPDAGLFDPDDADCTRRALASGRSCEVIVTFEPSGPGSASAILVVSADGGARNTEVPLEATAVGLLG